MDNIEKWRIRIDEIDEQLVKLFNERAACAIEIGNIKREKGMEIFNPDREKCIMEQISQLNEGPLSNEAIKKLFSKIIEECKNCELK